jgi:transposase
LAIDISTAECHFQALKIAKSAEIAQYFADLAVSYETKGFKKLHVFLDGNPTHKGKMQTLFDELMQDKQIDVQFHFIAPYSPKLNLVEYAIHLIRQKVLHHADCKTSLNEFVIKVKELCDDQKIVTKQKVENTLNHIYALVPDL